MDVHARNVAWVTTQGDMTFYCDGLVGGYFYSDLSRAGLVWLASLVIGVHPLYFSVMLTYDAEGKLNDASGLIKPVLQLPISFPNRALLKSA